MKTNEVPQFAAVCFGKLANFCSNADPGAAYFRQGYHTSLMWLEEYAILIPEQEFSTSSSVKVFPMSSDFGISHRYEHIPVGSASAFLPLTHSTNFVCPFSQHCCTESTDTIRGNSHEPHQQLSASLYVSLIRPSMSTRLPHNRSW